MSTLVIADDRGQALRRISLHGTDRMTIGRSTQRDLILNHPAVSRLHSVLYLEAGEWCIADAGSRGGTLVDGQRVLWKRMLPGRIASLGSFHVWIEPDSATDEAEERTRLPQLAPPPMDQIRLDTCPLCPAPPHEADDVDSCARTSVFLSAATDFLPLADSDEAA